jgi:threonine dehydrogenase-like Zn-dependent dehydrogenase
MRAALIHRPNQFQTIETFIPEPGMQQVLVRVEGCGVCASNLPVWEGRAWFNYPLAPGALGHEGWGHIEALGPEVDGFKVGDRVAFLSEHAYAEYDVAGVESLLRLPAQLDEQPFPGEPLGCAMNVFRRSDIQPGQTVAVIGIGFLGALLVQLAAQAGARVIAVSRRPFALDIARQFGATETLTLDDYWRIIQHVRDLTEGAGCARVIEAVGQQWALDLATELTGTRGRLVIAGYHQDGTRQVNLQLWNWRGLDVINAHERDPQVYREGMQAALHAILAGTLDPAPLYTHCFPLDQLDEALDTLRQRPAGFLKALVTV